MMTATPVSSLSLARERELGMFERLLVTPLRPTAVLIGKALPSMIVGLLDANLVMAAGLSWFAIPIRGSIVLLEAMLLLYLLAGPGIGLMISSIARTQERAKLCVLVVASPMAVASGYAAPVEDMPPIVELLGRVDSIHWMLVISGVLFVQDMPLAVLLQNMWLLALIAAVSFTVAGLAVQRAVT